LRGRLSGPFDLDAAPGALAISGASGSGKSLLMRMIADLDPNEGEVSLNGRSRADMTAPAWRRLVVYNAAEPGWWSEAVAPHFPGDTLEAVRALAPRIGLPAAVLDGAVTRLSSGERQRLGLLRALTIHPEVLLLDEPTGALDRETTLSVEALLRERVEEGVVLIVVTHDPDQPERLGARHLRLNDGRLEKP
jgi:putative ABC transport system ATP-binding protein